MATGRSRYRFCEHCFRVLRGLLLWLYPVMALFMLAAALSYHIPAESSAKIIVISLFVYLYVAAYSPGQGMLPQAPAMLSLKAWRNRLLIMKGPCAFLYSSESMPVTHREVESPTASSSSETMLTQLYRSVWDFAWQSTSFGK